MGNDNIDTYWASLNFRPSSRGTAAFIHCYGEDLALALLERYTLKSAWESADKGWWRGHLVQIAPPWARRYGDCRAVADRKTEYTLEEYQEFIDKLTATWNDPNEPRARSLTHNPANYTYAVLRGKAYILYEEGLQLRKKPLRGDK